MANLPWPLGSIVYYGSTHYEASTVPASKTRGGGAARLTTRWRGAEAGAASFCLRTITRVAAGAAKKLAQPACSRRHAYRMVDDRRRWVCNSLGNYKIRQRVKTVGPSAYGLNPLLIGHRETAKFVHACREFLGGRNGGEESTPFSAARDKSSAESMSCSWFQPNVCHGFSREYGRDAGLVLVSTTMHGETSR